LARCRKIPLAGHAAIGENRKAVSTGRSSEAPEGPGKAARGFRGAELEGCVQSRRRLKNVERAKAQPAAAVAQASSAQTVVAKPMPLPDA
jgi:hypothetical protein